jgi:hypothetical protein
MMIELLKNEIIEQLESCQDEDLLDLIHKLLLPESGNQLLDGGIVVGG